MYRSKKKKKIPLNSCGCTSTKTNSKINSPERNSDLDIFKCNFYLKTKGRHHKLCCGQNRKYRRWRQQTSSVSDFPNLLRSDSPIDTPELTSLISNSNEDLQQFPLDPSESNDSLLQYQPETESDSDSVFSTLKKRNLGTPTDVEIKVCVPISSQEKFSCTLLESCPLKNKPNENIRASLLSKSPENISKKSKVCRNRRISRIVKKLQDKEMLTNLITKLDKHSLTRDFVHSIEEMSTGKLPVNTIPHLVHLDAIRFHRVRDSRKMQYSSKMKRFWHCLYKLAGGPALRLLSGPRGTGERNFETSFCNINFAVPSITTLRHVQSNENRLINPGIFNSVLDKIRQMNLRKEKEFILSFDGKSVGTGLKDDSLGDVNLWNFETDPNLQESRERLEYEMKFINDLKNSNLAQNTKQIRDKLLQILKIVTERIQNVRSIIRRNEKTIAKYQKLDADNPNYRIKHQYTIQHSQYLIDQCTALIQRCLRVNRDLCEACAHLNQSSSLFSRNDIINISDQPNVRLLMEPEDLHYFFSQCNNTVYVKQRTNIWHRIRDTCPVTGSTLHSAIGLGTLIEQKHHHDYFVKRKEKPPPTPQVQQMMDYGTENEVFTFYSTIN